MDRSVLELWIPNTINVPENFAFHWHSSIRTHKDLEESPTNHVETKVVATNVHLLKEELLAKEHKTVQ